MEQFWYRDDLTNDNRLPHVTNPPQYLTAGEIFQKLGVRSWKVDVDNIDKDPELAKVKKELKLDFGDEVTINPEDVDEARLKSFETYEHLHPDDETRLFLGGGGYFDIRDPANDKWVRIRVQKGDMVMVPGGAYHRFTIDPRNHAKIKRYFSGVPKWTGFERPNDDHPARLEYLGRLGLAQ